MARSETTTPSLRELRAQLDASDGFASSAASLRVLERYRRLILLGRVALPLAEARRVLGPDREYRLYGGIAGAGRTGRRRSRRRQRQLARG